MKEYLFVSFLEQSKAERFKAWPLHVTLVPWFKSDYETARKVADSVSSRNKQFTVRALGRASFGPSNNIPVRLIEKSPEIITLHTSLLTHLDEEGVSYRGLRYVAGNYEPHVTVRSGNVSVVSSEIRIDSITIVEKVSEYGDRIIRDSFVLVDEDERVA